MSSPKYDRIAQRDLLKYKYSSFGEGAPYVDADARDTCNGGRWGGPRGRRRISNELAEGIGVKSPVYRASCIDREDERK